jgi:hypothetical protein
MLVLFCKYATTVQLKFNLYFQEFFGKKKHEGKQFFVIIFTIFNY